MSGDGFTRPSRIRSHIKAMFPRDPVPDCAADYMAPPSFAGDVAMLAEDLARIDPRVIAESLTPDEETRLRRARARMAAQVSRWASGDRDGMYRTNELGGNPIAVAYELLGKCADEARPVAIERLPFISDEKLRLSIATDIDSMERHLRDGEWKSATVLAGSVIEAMLLDAVATREDEARRAASAADPKLNAPPDLQKWILHALVVVARALDVITDKERDAADQTRDFRNLIHPGVTLRTQQECTRGTARIAAGGVDMVIARLKARM